MSSDRPGKMNIVSPSRGESPAAMPRARVDCLELQRAAADGAVDRVGGDEHRGAGPRGVEPSAPMTTTRTTAPRSETRADSAIEPRLDHVAPTLRARPPTGCARASPGASSGADRPVVAARSPPRRDSAISTEMPSISGGSPTAFER